MDYELSAEHQMMQSAVKEIAADYDKDYWQEIHEDQLVPEAIFEDLAQGGWFGIPIPEEYGGHGMGLLDTIIVMEALAEAHAWETTFRFTMSTVFGGTSIMQNGTEAQKEQYLPGIAAGEDVWALGLTEPSAGLNATNMTTSAEKDGDEWVINGQKQWTSGMEFADKLLLVARTEPRDEVEKRTEGVTMFILDPDMDGISYNEIPLDIYFTEPTYDLFLGDVRVPEECVLGDVGQGLYQIFGMLNAERLTAAVSAWGGGKEALDTAVQYAKDREVWSEPIGAHQAIQHPLADAHAEMESARHDIRRAAWLADQGRDGSGEAANIANLQAGKAAWNACEAAMTTLGGMSASQEMGVAAAWGVVRHLRTGPVSEEMILNHIGQHSLGLPRSYKT
ncbi:acyl-CoA dehydrogenase family protein [Natronosalvus amylolyticus]|uniref:acyl-CoA dehydrogenase family protein n=1 Tax=Natronosalvus amylolyticus TaxID=2961994 RepID=UPI0020C9E937|nr:acyl-CoA dehydrogenase family protein [Natronosalvus amylolyticus]